MRFLLDVHVGASVASALLRQNHDVLSAIDGHADWTDVALLDLAVRENRVLITEDRDFSDLIYRDASEAPPGVIYIRCGPADLPTMADRLILVLANTNVVGHMVVIQRTSVRHRSLPGKKANDA
ncbi:DUF5615 family PIN-like protein [Sphingomonas sp.]|uniref:DUF5615 family PIN-like protein n=1 Tax=Sphingomonas sp. TaxID=28214 RepID=UPI003B008390